MLKLMYKTTIVYFTVVMIPIVCTGILFLAFLWKVNLLWN